MPYPKVLPTDKLMDIAIGYLRGQPVDTAIAVETLYDTLGFGLSFAFPLPPTGLKGVKPLTNEEAADALESLKGGAKGVQGFNWLQLVMAILDLLSKLG